MLGPGRPWFLDSCVMLVSSPPAENMHNFVQYPHYHIQRHHKDVVLVCLTMTQAIATQYSSRCPLQTCYIVLVNYCNYATMATVVCMQTCRLVLHIFRQWWMHTAICNLVTSSSQTTFNDRLVWMTSWSIHGDRG